MSGCGRKHRAKHLTRQFLDAAGWTHPAAGESMAVCVESPQGQHVRVLLFTQPFGVGLTDGDGATGDHSVEERVVFVPGKFHKVIWLAVRDIIVVADRTTVAFKPSPEQLKFFFRSYPEWKLHLTSLQEKVDGCRRVMEQQPQYASVMHTTTSVLLRVADKSQAKEGVEDAQLNPNRNTIRHKVPFFYGEDEDDDDDDEEEEEEEEENK